MQSYRLITVSVLVDRLKINGSLARKALADLEEKGQIKKVVSHNSGNIYSEYMVEPMSVRDGRLMAMISSPGSWWR